MREVMKKLVLAVFAIVISFGFGFSNASAQMMKSDNPMVGGAAMYRTKDIVDNAVN